MDCKYAVKNDLDNTKINHLEPFPLYLDCQDNHYLGNSIGNSTFKPNHTHHGSKTTHNKNHINKNHTRKLFPLIEKENLSDSIKLTGPSDISSKYTINKIFNLQNLLYNIPLSKIETQNIFLSVTANLKPLLKQKYQYLQTVIRQPKSWHKYKIKPMKADMTIRENTKLLRYSRNFRIQQ